MIQRLVQAGYLYELVGLVYYAFFLIAMRRPGRFSQRTRVLTLLAAIVLVASVPFRYAGNAIGVTVMVVLAVASIISTWVDRRAFSR